jgi:eukaryotic-like serine/threonine-protein kinase
MFRDMKQGPVYFWDDRQSGRRDIVAAVSLQTGTRLGPYEIVGAIGEGGMGEVYRAKDTRLGREVALKVLPAAVADDQARRARFEREAQTVATLSHPNIVSLFDTGTHDGRLFVVMELLEGETLRDRLAKGPLPVRKTVEISTQIARGLSAAHEKGLVHRDLKPANIFLVGDGQVKILDFGLARQTAVSDIAETRTTDAMTDPGAVMGTIGYMAPEQVRGESVDGRCDLFAFGAVLYEMLSGRRAFQRDTAAETMTAILREDPPDLFESRSGMSPAVARIVNHCLEKSPVERFQTARDVAFALDSLSASGTGSGAAALPSQPKLRGGSLRWIGVATAAAALGVLAGVFGARWFERPPESIEFITKTFDDSIVSYARFLPDGKSIVYSASINGQPDSLYELRDSSTTPRPFGPAATQLLAISKTGELAVLTDARPSTEVWVTTGTLARMTVDTAPRSVLSGVSGADWSPDGQQLAIVRRVDGLAQLEYPMGKVLYKTSGYVSDIRVAPDGRNVLFMDHQTPNDNRGWVKTVDPTGRVTTLAGEFPAEAGLAWSVDGRGVFYSLIDGQEPVFSIRRLDIARPASAPRRSIVPSSASMTILDVSPNGSLLTKSDRSRGEVGVKLRGEATLRDLSWLDRSWSPSLSSDGTLLLFTHGHTGPNYGAALRRTDGSPVIHLGPGATMGISPDGRWAVAALLAATPPQLMAYPTGPGAQIALPRGPVEVYDPDIGGGLWLPDSSAFLFQGSERGRPTRSYIQRVHGGDPRAVLPEGVRPALVSRDGRSVVAREAGGPWRLYPLDGELPALPLPGLTQSDRPAGWTEDDQAVVVATGSRPVRLDRVNIRTGARSLLREIASPSRAALNMNVRSVTADGDQFAYTTGLLSTTLHVVTGVRGVK